MRRATGLGEERDTHGPEAAARMKRSMADEVVPIPAWAYVEDVEYQHVAGR